MFEGDSQYAHDFFNNLKYFLTYTNNIFVPIVVGERVIFYFAWSLAVEEQFYSVWPWIEKYFSSKSILLLLVALLGFLVSLQSGFLFEGSVSDTILKILVIPICLGALLAHLLNEEKTYTYLQKLFKYKYSSLFLFASFLTLLSFESVEIVPVFIVMTLFIGACVANPGHFMASILDNKFIAHIGKVSYGMYLIHMLCYNAVKLGLTKLDINNNGINAFVLTSILTIIAATISFYTFERYFLNLKKKYG
jgi:peptidoglycan/LPS O-acetylase OafA/YrhL